MKTPNPGMERVNARGCAADTLIVDGIGHLMRRIRKKSAQNRRIGIVLESLSMKLPGLLAVAYLPAAIYFHIK
jgi:hypothetical protein